MITVEEILEYLNSDRIEDMIDIYREKRIKRMDSSK